MKKQQKNIFFFICHFMMGDDAAIFTYFNIEKGIQTVLQRTQQTTILKNINHEAEYQVNTQKRMRIHEKKHLDYAITKEVATPQTRNLMFTSSSYIFIAGREPEELSSSSAASSTSGASTVIFGGSPRRSGPTLSNSSSTLAPSGRTRLFRKQ